MRLTGIGTGAVLTGSRFEITLAGSKHLFAGYIGLGKTVSTLHPAFSLHKTCTAKRNHQLLKVTTADAGGFTDTANAAVIPARGQIDHGLEGVSSFCR